MSSSPHPISFLLRFIPAVPAEKATKHDNWRRQMNMFDNGNDNECAD